MLEFSDKQIRKIKNQLEILLGKRAFISYKALKENNKMNEYFLRKIKNKNGNNFLSDNGLKAMREIVDLINSTNKFTKYANSTDVKYSFIEVYENLLENSIRSIDTNEFITKIIKKIESNIDVHNFAVPLYGVELDGIETIELESIKILKLDIKYFDYQDVKYDKSSTDKIFEYKQYNIWLIGTVKGTFEVAKQRFAHLSDLVVGLIVLSATINFQRGANLFRIGTVMSPEQGSSKANWFSWTDNKKTLSISYNFISHKLLEINNNFINSNVMSYIFKNVLIINDKENKNELEIAIIKSVYWFSDANRETVNTMSFLKYWSCIEVFFSYDQNNIVKNIANGLSNILVYGPIKCIEESNYSSLKSEIKKYYEYRSKIVHSADYSLINEGEVSKLSLWVSWLLINILKRVNEGCITLNTINNKDNIFD